MSARRSDLDVVRDAVDAFVLFRRAYYRADRLLADLRARRREVVLDELDARISLHRERAAQDRRLVAHFLRNPVVYGRATPEVVERFERLAAREERAVARLERVYRAVARDGIPPAVSEYVPTWLLRDVAEVGNPWADPRRFP